MALMTEASNNARRALVAMKFDTSRNGSRIAVVEARAEGILSYVLTHLGASDKTVIEFFENHVKVANSSWSGTVFRVIPYSMISASRAGFLKPFSALMFGIVSIAIACAIGYDEPLCWWVGAAGLFFIIDYLISKTISIALYCNSGEVIRIIAKRGILDWCPIDEREALRFSERLNELIVAANS